LGNCQSVKLSGGTGSPITNPDKKGRAAGVQEAAPAAGGGEGNVTIEERLDRIEAMLALLVERQTVKEFYEIEEFARLVGKAAFTVREWARHGRIRAEKKLSGRGAYARWVVSHAELLRYQREGLLPLPSAG
jgi:hypothetical protein